MEGDGGSKLKPSFGFILHWAFGINRKTICMLCEWWLLEKPCWAGICFHITSDDFWSGFNRLRFVSGFGVQALVEMLSCRAAACLFFFFFDV